MPKKILVVDDEKEYTEMIALFIGLRGYETIQANSGRTALDILSKEPIDLMTLDLSMPGMDGIEVAKAVNQKYPDLKILIISGFGRDFDEELSKVKVNGIFTKPADLMDLLGKVKELIG